MIGLIILTISIGYIFVNKEIPYLCNRGIETLCGLWGNKMYANTNIKCLGWHKDVSGLVYYLIWDNDVNKIIEVRAWELR